ncbi:hypothetical protein EVAR_67120_1 [Eumeta japonica]|uniref:Uncharacterized protein n=1 Tax=Eumeta variegata TaxID=151549 RepID=A0A4C1ZX02_EUMVA|nr:hypothetical protein EVAR_67120_1 [Eumeta japonica]
MMKMQVVSRGAARGARPPRTTPGTRGGTRESRRNKSFARLNLMRSLSISVNDTTDPPRRCRVGALRRTRHRRGRI